MGAWSIPKGEVEPDEDNLETAKREFKEEIGDFVPDPPSLRSGEAGFLTLGSVTQKGGKVVHAWAVACPELVEWDPKAIKSNTFKMEWPPRSGEEQEFPEIDRAEFFEIEEAKLKINQAQVKLLETLEAKLGL